MKNIGLIIATLSLVVIAYSDFRFKVIPSLSLAALIIGFSIYLPVQSWWVKLALVSIISLIILVLNLTLIKLDKTKIQTGDVKIIIILAWFFNFQNLLITLLVGSGLGVLLNLNSKSNKVALGGLLALAAMVIIHVKL
jgi:prepilin signal peptidase PulO-like enzyme (type II secretory pathway)